ncbi:MAG TPA: AAA family ATPase [Spirochaetes bacterium]|nr:AAA family ATPase [Spirochaetota bacterium]
MTKPIAFIAPYKKLAELFDDVCRELKKDIHIEIGDLDEGVRKAVELEEKGFDVVISRGGTAAAMKGELINLSVVEIQVSGFDLIRVLQQAKEHTDKIAIVGFNPFTDGIKDLGDIFNIELNVITLDFDCFHHTDSIKTKLEDIKKMGINWVVGDTISVKTAKELGLNALLIRSGKEALIQALFEAERVLKVKRQESEKAKRVKTIIDYAYEGIISINRAGVIDTFNPRAEEIFNKEAYKVIGKNIGEVLPGMDLLNTVQNGCTSKGKVWAIDGIKIVANVIPIIINKEIVKVIVTFQKVSQIQKVEQKIREELYLKGHTAENSFDDIIGESEVILYIKEEARNYAQVDSPILIYGETGTGKELFAQAIHNVSLRKNKPFVAVNCAALPENLLESELFGYVEGAFTGANKKGKMGLFEQAHEGTIFLDEIGEISINLQSRLLRVIQERKVRRLGDNKLTHVDVRVVASTNKDLYSLIECNTFREDLYYRINVLNINLPPLRARKIDIPLLANYFVRKYTHKFKIVIEGISKEGTQLLMNYNWPGNIRQLENIIERLMVKTKEGYITAKNVKFVLKSLPGSKLILGIDDGYGFDTPQKSIRIPLMGSLEDIERTIIEKVIQKENGNKTAAAEKLGIGRTTLWRKINNN